MAPSGDEQARVETLTKMAESRAEIRRLLEPPPGSPGDDEPEADDGPYRPDGQFPRSRTMRMLLSGRGLGAMGAVVGGVLLARPALALRLLRMVPASAIGKALAFRALASLRDKQARRR